MSLITDLTTIAVAHSGCIPLAVALEHGIERRRLRAAEQSGTLSRIFDDVYRFTSTPLSDALAMRGAVLQLPDATLSHQTAGLIYGAPLLRPTSVTVSTPAPSHRRYAGLTVHRVCDLRPEFLTFQDGLPVTTLERTVVDLAAVCSPSRLGAIIDEFTIRSRRTTVARIGVAFAHSNHHGRRGVGRIRAILDTRTSQTVTPRSKLEPRLDAALAAAGLSSQHEHPLPSEGAMEGLVDRFVKEAMWIIEIDGRPWHGRHADMKKDRQRDRQAGRLGYHTTRILDEEIDFDFDGVVSDLVATYAMRVAQVGSLLGVAPTAPTQLLGKE